MDSFGSIHILNTNEFSVKSLMADFNIKISSPNFSTYEEVLLFQRATSFLGGEDIKKIICADLTYKLLSSFSLYGIQFQNNYSVFGKEFDLYSGCFLREYFSNNKDITAIGFSCLNDDILQLELMKNGVVIALFRYNTNKSKHYADNTKNKHYGFKNIESIFGVSKNDLIKPFQEGKTAFDCVQEWERLLKLPLSLNYEKIDLNPCIYNAKKILG